MFKHKISFLFALMMTMFLCVGPIYAAGSVAPLASVSLWSVQAETYSGPGVGEIEIFYNVSAKGSVTTCGVSSIKIYEEDDTYVATIYGTLSNGLLISGGKHIGSYFYDGESGTSYYAKVTLYAGGPSGSDSRTVTTSVVRAP